MDYITIIQGDDTNFLDDQFLLITFNTDIDLSGFTAIFSLENVTLTYGNLSSKTFNIVLSNDITSNLTIGKKYGEIKLIDTSNRIKTITSVIPFLIKKGVNEDIRISNSSLNVSMNVNNTAIDILIETPGISKTEAQKILASCNEAVQLTQSNVNTSINVLNQLNELNELIEEANNTCQKGVREIAMASQDKLNLIITKGNQVEGIAQEALDILDSRADKDLEELSDVGKAKLGGNRFCISSGPFDSSGNPNALFIDDEPVLGPMDQWVGFGTERFVILSAPVTYIDGMGIANTVSYKICEEVTNYEVGNYSIQVYKDQQASNYKLKLIKDCTVYRSKKEPNSPKENDLWLDTSNKPFKAYCYSEVTLDDGDSGSFFEDMVWCEWQETNLVEIGRLQKKSDDEYVLINFHYNSSLANIPDYRISEYVPKNEEVIAECSGVLMGNITSTTASSLTINNNVIPFVPSGDEGFFYIPIAVGDVYKITNYNACRFFPYIS
ncbi:hypothetical protein IJX73_00910 [bacterium]|nr:hypothetical protein [bacterium]MBQ9149469.1 hypothetical protein [bacterium]